MSDPTPNELEAGVTSNGETWSVARYGTTVVVTVADESDDTEWITEGEAKVEFNDAVKVFLNADNEAGR